MKTISEIHQAFESKKSSPVELAKDFLTRVKASKHNAYLTVCEDRALEQAKQAQSVLEKNNYQIPESKPLLGIPMGIKDVLTIDGVRTTCASKMLENYIPPYTSTAVERLENAGGITLGKLNMDEFAMGSSNENSAYGPVQHPTHPGYVPRGSSGGSAAAVKAGLCTIALGSDTGGSIRLPASYCGTVGMRPTYGRISRYGLIAFASSLDQTGPLTHTVEDSARVMDVIAGPDSRDSTCLTDPKTNWTKGLNETMDWSKLRVGVPKEYFIEGMGKEVLQSIHASIDWFKAKGAKVVDISLPHTRYAIATYYVVAVSEASSNLARFDGVRFGVRPKEAQECEDLAEFYKKVRANFGSEVKRRILLGTFALSSGYYDAYYIRACQVRRKIKEDFDQAFQKCDVIVGPVAPDTAFKMGEKSNDPIKMYLVDIYTIPSSLAGIPCLSVPCGVGREGLPIGLHMIGPHDSDGLILKLAHAFEKGRA